MSRSEAGRRRPRISSGDTRSSSSLGLRIPIGTSSISYPPSSIWCGVSSAWRTRAAVISFFSFFYSPLTIPRELPSLEPLADDDEPRSIVIKALAARPAPVHEKEKVPGERILTRDTLHPGKQRIVRRPHVGRLPAYENLRSPIQSDHDLTPPSSGTQSADQPRGTESPCHHSVRAQSPNRACYSAQCLTPRSPVMAPTLLNSKKRLFSRFRV